MSASPPYLGTDKPAGSDLVTLEDLKQAEKTDLQEIKETTQEQQQQHVALRHSNGRRVVR